MPTRPLNSLKTGVIAIVILLAGCKTQHQTKFRDPSEDYKPSIEPTNVPAAFIPLYPDLPGDYVDRDGRRKLHVEETIQNNYRFVYVSKLTGEVYFDGILSSELEGRAQRTKNLATGVFEDVIIADLKSKNVSLKRLSKWAPDPIHFQRIER